MWLEKKQTKTPGKKKKSQGSIVLSSKTEKGSEFPQLNK